MATQSPTTTAQVTATAKELMTQVGDLAQEKLDAAKPHVTAALDQAREAADSARSKTLPAITAGAVHAADYAATTAARVRDAAEEMAVQATEQLPGRKKRRSRRSRLLMIVGIAALAAAAGVAAKKLGGGKHGPAQWHEPDSDQDPLESTGTVQTRVNGEEVTPEGDPERPHGDPLT